jgi:hypothetical protein
VCGGDPSRWIGIDVSWRVVFESGSTFGTFAQKYADRRIDDYRKPEQRRNPGSGQPGGGIAKDRLARRVPLGFSRALVTPPAHLVEPPNLPARPSKGAVFVSDIASKLAVAKAVRDQ